MFVPFESTLSRLLIEANSTLFYNNALIFRQFPAFSRLFFNESRVVRRN